MARPSGHGPGRVAALVLVAVALAGCGGGNGEGSGEAAPEESAGRTLFAETAQPSCASCHTLADAGAAGTVGPNLDEAKPSREKVLSALRQGPGAMPTYTDKLEQSDLDALADYVSTAASS